MWSFRCVCGISGFAMTAPTDSTDPDVVWVRLPRADWRQIVSDIENMCGTSASEIEILQSAAVSEDPAAAERARIADAIEALPHEDQSDCCHGRVLDLLRAGLVEHPVEDGTE